MFIIQNVFPQCDCQKILRDNVYITQCNPLQVGGDNSLQMGMSLSSNGEDDYINLIIRYLDNQPYKIIGDLNIRCVDNNLLTFKLINSQSSYIGNSKIESGIFLLSVTQFKKIQNSKLLTISIRLSDGRIHTIDVSFNQDVLITQSKCL